MRARSALAAPVTHGLGLSFIERKIMSQSPNTKNEPSFDDPVDPSQVGDQNDSRYLEWLKLNPKGTIEEWRRSPDYDERDSSRSH
jgi:hypothetical protein